MRQGGVLDQRLGPGGSIRTPRCGISAGSRAAPRTGSTRPRRPTRATPSRGTAALPARDRAARASARVRRPCRAARRCRAVARIGAQVDRARPGQRRMLVERRARRRRRPDGRRGQPGQRRALAGLLSPNTAQTPRRRRTRRREPLLAQPARHDQRDRGEIGVDERAVARPVGRCNTARPRARSIPTQPPVRSRSSARSGPTRSHGGPGAASVRHQKPPAAATSRWRRDQQRARPVEAGESWNPYAPNVVLRFLFTTGPSGSWPWGPRALTLPFVWLYQQEGCGR